MSKEKWNKIWVGIVVGLTGAILGFILFGIGFGIINNVSFTSFVNDIFFGVTDFQSRIVTFSMLIDVVLFFIFIRKDYQEMCKGLMVVLVLSVVAVASLY